MSFLIATSCSRSSESGLSPGSFAPEIKLSDLDGKQYSLNDFKGKLILLNFWASWCHPCIEEMPALQRLQDKLGEEKFVVVAVAVEDNDAAVKEMKTKLGLTFPILIDRLGLIRDSYKVNGYPETFFIDPEGKIMLFMDAENKDLRLKLVGPRRWDSANMINSVSSYLP